MDIGKRIDDVYEKMHTMPLSAILPMLLPIALELSDYEGYCIVTYWGKPISNDSNLNKELWGEMERTLLDEGLNLEEIKKVHISALRKYLKFRNIGNNQVLSLCAKEMEDKVNLLNQMIDVLKIPDGMAPVDIYFKNEAVTKEKLSIIKNKQQIEQQYAVLQSYLMMKLAEYRRIASFKERKKELEKGIKNSKKVFIIHGHDEAKRRELEGILKEKFGLIPVVLQDQPTQGLTIIEKFEKYAVDCSYAFALFTPDDIVTNGDKQYFQARPNVIFELGWFYATLGRSRVCILDQASEQSNIFSDLQGVLRIQFNKDISEKYLEIERELKTLGMI